MPEIPQEAVTAAAKVLAHFISGTEHEPYPEPDAEDIQWAVAALEAAGRTLAGHIGVKILRYSDEHEPEPGSPDYLAWHRSFTAAAEVATSAFGDR